jgi:hypothetical protein
MKKLIIWFDRLRAYLTLGAGVAHVDSAKVYIWMETGSVHNEPHVHIRHPDFHASIRLGDFAVLYCSRRGDKRKLNRVIAVLRPLQRNLLECWSDVQAGRSVVSLGQLAR